MSKKDKIIAVCFVASFVLVVVSSIYAINLNKPSGNVFNVERVLRKMF